MNSIDFASLMTTVFVLVDDGYRQYQVMHPPAARPGACCRFSDSEVLSLALLMDDLPFPGETQFLSFIRANGFVA